MAWVELQWGVPRPLVEVLSQRLFSFGTLGVQEDFLPGQQPPPRQPWDTGPPIALPEVVLLKAWWPFEGREVVQLQVQELCQRHPQCHLPRWNIVGEEDWGEAWKHNFHRHEIAPSLAVSPPWEAQDGDLVIEPGIAFGTGEHPTTRSCLEALAQWACSGKTCLDVGCGSGILSLAAAKLGMTATGVDIEEQAVQSARENALQNNLSASFSCDDIATVSSTFDVVVANLYAEVLVRLSTDIVRCCRHRLALAGVLVSKEDMVLEAYTEMNLTRRTIDGEWVSLWYSR